MEGWIKLHRKITDNEFYFSEPFTRAQAWIDMLILANHKDGILFKRGIKVEIKRGQIGYNFKNLGKRWSWSRGKIDRFMDTLESSNQIVTQKTNVTTLISILNYEEYQGDGKANDKPISKPKGKANGHQTVSQTEPNKNVNNNNNENNDKNLFSDKNDFLENDYMPGIGKKEKIEIPKEFKNPFSDEFLKTWDTWKLYKKQQHKFEFKSEITEQASINNLSKLSEGSEALAIEIIYHTMANGWQGFVKPKTEENGTGIQVLSKPGNRVDSSTGSLLARIKESANSGNSNGIGNG